AEPLTSGLEVVRLFSVLRDVQTFDFFRLGDAYARNHIRYFEQNDGPYQRKAPSNQNAHQLIAKLSPMAIQTAYRLARAENRVDHLLCEDSSQEGADGATRAVRAEGIQGVIIAEDRLYFRHHEVADQARDKANRESRHRSDETRGRGNRHKPSDGPGNRTQSARSPILDPLRDAPADGGRSCGKVRGHKGACRERTRGQRAAGVKTKPPDPEQTCADKTQHQRVGWHGLPRIAGPLPEIQRTHQRRDSRTDMHYRSTRKIQRWEFSAEGRVQEPAFA